MSPCSWNLRKTFAWSSTVCCAVCSPDLCRPGIDITTAPCCCRVSIINVHCSDQQIALLGPTSEYSLHPRRYTTPPQTLCSSFNEDLAFNLALHLAEDMNFLCWCYTFKMMTIGLKTHIQKDYQVVQKEKNWTNSCVTWWKLFAKTTWQSLTLKTVKQR